LTNTPTYTPTNTLTNTPTNTPTVTATNTATPTPVPTCAPSNPPALPSGHLILLNTTWRFQGSGPIENDKVVNLANLSGKNTVRISINIHGSETRPGDASAFAFVQDNSWKYIALHSYIEHRCEGTQIVDIPLSAFSGLRQNKPISNIHSRFWSPIGERYFIEIYSVIVY
jgi:hypothetical protein